MSMDEIKRVELRHSGAEMIMICFLLLTYARNRDIL